MVRYYVRLFYFYPLLLFIFFFFPPFFDARRKTEERRAARVFFFFSFFFVSQKFKIPERAVRSFTGYTCSEYLSVTYAYIRMTSLPPSPPRVFHVTAVARKRSVFLRRARTPREHVM